MEDYIMKKRLLALFLALTLSVGIAPLTATAADNFVLPAYMRETRESPTSYRFTFNNDPVLDLTLTTQGTALTVAGNMESIWFLYGEKDESFGPVQYLAAQLYGFGSSTFYEPANLTYGTVSGAIEIHNNSVTFVFGPLPQGEYGLSFGVRSEWSGYDKQGLRMLVTSSGLEFPAVEAYAEYYTANQAIVDTYQAPVGRDYFASQGAAVTARALEITAGITDPYLQARAIHAWVGTNIKYDYAAADLIRIGQGSLMMFLEQSPEYVLQKGIAVCDGYAGLMAAMLNVVGIPARRVAGPVGGEDHAWTEAYIDGTWLYMDATTDTNLRKFDMSLEELSIAYLIESLPEADSVPRSPGSSQYSIPSTWAAESVNTAIRTGIISKRMQTGYTQNISRLEFCILAVALYETVTGTTITQHTTFRDSTAPDVQKAAAIGIVTGVGDNRFDPNAYLTREQAATMLARLAAAVGKPLTAESATFADSANVSPWAAESIGQMQATGVMTGVGNNMFAPQEPYTTEQSIITMLRLYDMLK